MTIQEELQKATRERDIAVSMLADWVIRVKHTGTGWDDWDEAYKNAAYRDCPIRELIDSKVKELERLDE